jgi:hypothetical protein
MPLQGKSQAYSQPHAVPSHRRAACVVDLTPEPPWALAGTAQRSAHSGVPEAGATRAMSPLRSARGIRSPLQPTTAQASRAPSARVWSRLLNTRTCQNRHPFYRSQTLLPSAPLHRSYGLL